MQNDLNTSSASVEPTVSSSPAPVAPAKPVAKRAKPVAVSTRKLNTKRATSAPAKLGAAAEAQRNAGRSNVAKPDASAKPGKPAATPAKPSGNVSRTASTIAKLATNFGGVLSDRDNAYIAFYASFAKRAKNGLVTVADIHASGRKPAYSGSAKPHDAGVIVRLSKAGILKPALDGTSFTFTKHGAGTKPYASAKA